LALLGSLVRQARSGWLSFPASSPESALRRCEELQKNVRVSWVSSVFRLVLSENRQAFRKASLQADLVERTSFPQPPQLAKHLEEHSRSANPRQV
jgi:hypothetical protein